MKMKTRLAFFVTYLVSLPFGSQDKEAVAYG